MHASKLNKTEIIKALLAKGADVNKRDAKGQTAAMSAIRYEPEKPGGGSIPFHNISVEALKLLIENGANVNAKDNAGKTALNHIIEEGHNQCNTQEILGIAKLLLGAPGIIIDTQSENISSLFFSAVRNNDTSLIRILADKGMNINIKGKSGKTALTGAVELAGSNYRFAYSVRLLLEKGADVNAQDDDGNTALIHTIKNKSDHSLELVELLIAKGVDSSIKNKEGKIASDYNDVRRTQIQKLLEKADISKP